MFKPVSEETQQRRENQKSFSNSTADSPVLPVVQTEKKIKTHMRMGSTGETIKKISEEMAPEIDVSQLKLEDIDEKPSECGASRNSTLQRVQQQQYSYFYKVPDADLYEKSSTTFRPHNLDKLKWSLLDTSIQGRISSSMFKEEMKCYSGR